MLMIMLSTMIFIGLKHTSPNLKNSLQKRVNDHNMHNVKVLTYSGLRKKDKDILRNDKDIENIEYYFNKVLPIENNQDKIALYSRTDRIDTFKIVMGHMPRNEKEIVLDSILLRDDFHPEKRYKLGDTIKLINEKSQLEDDKEILKNTEFKVVGFVESISHLLNNRNSSEGLQNYSFFGVTTKDAFNIEYEDYAVMTLNSLKAFDPLSKEYKKAEKDRVEAIKIRFENRSKELEDEMKSSANEDISDGEKEIKDAKQKLVDAKNDLIKAKSDLNDAKIKLDDGWKEYEDSKKDTNKKLDDAQKEIDDGFEKLKKAKEDIKQAQYRYEEGLYGYEKEISSAQKELDANKAKLDAAKKDLDANKAALDAKQKELEGQKAGLISQKADLESKETELKNTISELETNKAALEAGLNEAKQGQAALEAQIAALNITDETTDPLLLQTYQALMAKLEEVKATITTLEGNLKAVNDGLTQSKEGLSQVQAGIEQIDQGLPKIEAGLGEIKKGSEALTEGYSTYEDSLKKYEAGLAEFNKEKAAGKKELDAAKAKIDSGNKEVAENENKLLEAQRTLDKNKITAYDKLQDARKELEDATKKYQDGLAEYHDGLKEYEENEAKADKEIKDAEKDIADAKEKVADIEIPLYQISGRYNDRVYALYMNQADGLEVLALLFTGMFYLVAILVTLTTLLRMVETDRVQIGTLKALGYYNSSILKKYMFYGLSSAFIGSVAGLPLGFFIFVKPILNAYLTETNVKQLTEIFRWPLGLAIVAVSLLLIAVTTMIAVKSELNENAASLMRPKPPKKAKKTIFERIPILWKNLSFLQKVALRNVVRHKSRIMMTILGIAGSFALITLGFGIKYSVGDVASKQFEDIYRFDLQVYYDDKMDDFDELNDLLKANNKERLDLISGQMDFMNTEGYREKLEVNAFDEKSRLSDFINLKERDGEKNLSLNGKDVVITEKLALVLDKKVGDEITVLDDKNISHTLKITGITEQYMSHKIYMTKDHFKEVFDKDAVDDQVLLKADQDQIKTIKDKSGDLESALAVVTSADMRESLANLSESLNIIVLIIVAISAMLTFIVLYNLTNINISERVRELSTIKVLGFRPREVLSYVFKENIFLLIAGFAFGILLGNLLHHTIIFNLSPQDILFDPYLKPISYLFSALIVVFFTLVVMFVTGKHIEKIDMVEALKAVD